ncbi:ATP-binding protein [Candidatus Peregrinibacteria bacterium]|nr:ATP-binding protein [Candidatus Peregrinibacteria bacterium]
MDMRNETSLALPGHPEQPIRITMTLPTNAYFLSGIRDFTFSLAKNVTGFSEQWAYRCQAVIDELCNNAIEHGSKPGDSVTICIESIVGKYIEFSVEDNGSGHPVNAEEMNKLIHERKIPSYIQHIGVRGRGLPQIVIGWTDELEFSDLKPHGLKVRARKYFDKAHETQSVPNRFSLKTFALT